MCGIAGFFTRHAWPASVQATLARMQTALLHRGRDGDGMWVDPAGTCGLTHVRLAVIDPTPSGAQPMTSADGRFVISFNGEIYNFRALRTHMQGRGIAFRTDSDTEVLLALLQHDGPASLSRLRGMFSLAVWDLHRQRGLLARDGFGIKPLYYARTADGIVFASELRGLLACGAVPLRLNPAAVAGFFATGSVPEPETLVEGVCMLPPGHCLEWSASGSRTTAFWTIDFPEPSTCDPADAVRLTRLALEDSIAAHFVSDVPVGLFLSGGIDSSALLALARTTDQARNLTAFSIEVDDGAFNEADVAAATARTFGASHHVLRLDAATARDGLAGFLNSMDVPSVDGFNTWTVSGLARAHGYKVVLSGLGGDEMFGGYPSFSQVALLHRATRALAGMGWAGRGIGEHLLGNARASRWRRAGELIQPGTTLVDAYRAYRGIFPLTHAIRLASHFTGVDEHAVRESLQVQAPPLPRRSDQISYLEITRYMRNQLLRDSDVMSMAHGLELRLPLVDQRLFDTISTIPSALRLQPGKQLLLDAVPEIPAQVRTARKRGFSFPIRAWLEDDLGPEFASATRGLPVDAHEWYQQWSVLAFSRWLGARGSAAAAPSATVNEQCQLRSDEC